MMARPRSDVSSNILTCFSLFFLYKINVIVPYYAALLEKMRDQHTFSHLRKKHSYFHFKMFFTISYNATSKIGVDIIYLKLQ